MMTTQQEWDTEKVLTIPNVVSAIRLLAIPVFCWLIVVGRDVAAVTVLVIFGATDWIDGYLARKLRQRTALGAKLDPAADRLYILTAVLVLLVRHIVPWWFVATLFARDFMLVCLVPFLRRHGLVALPVKYIGKAGTMMLLVAMPLILVGAPTSLHLVWAHWIGWFLGGLGAVLYWLAGLAYVADVIRLSRSSHVETT